MAKRGFGSPKFSRERMLEIASMGGKAAQAAGKAHRWDAVEASVAGRKGGVKSGQRKRELEARAKLAQEMKERM